MNPKSKGNDSVANSKGFSGLKNYPSRAKLPKF